MPFAWTAVHLANIVSSAGQPDRDSDSEGGEEAVRLGRGSWGGKESPLLAGLDTRLSLQVCPCLSHLHPHLFITATAAPRAQTCLDRPPPSGACGPDE